MANPITAAARAGSAPQAPLVIGLLRDVIERKSKTSNDRPAATGDGNTGTRFDAVA